MRVYTVCENAFFYLRVKKDEVELYECECQLNHRPYDLSDIDTLCHQLVLKYLAEHQTLVDHRTNTKSL